MALVLRELAVRLGLKTNEAEFARGQLAADAIKFGLSKIVEFAKHAAESFVELVKSTAEYADEVGDTAQAMGLSSRALQELRKAAVAGGSDVETLDAGVLRLSRSMVAAKKGSEEISGAFHRLGTRVTDSRGKLRQTDDVLMDLAAGIAKMPDGAEKTALAMDVFGRSGARLIPMLNAGREGIAQWRAQATVMTDEQIEAGDRLSKSLKQLQGMTKNFWRQAIAPLLPAINELVQKYIAWRKANNALLLQNVRKYLGYVVEGIKYLGRALEAVIQIVGTLKAILGDVGQILARVLISDWNMLGSTAKKVLAGIAAAAAIAFAPFVALGAVVAGFLLLVNSIRRYQQGKSSMFGLWKRALDEWMKPRDDEPWFVAAIRNFVKLIEKALKLIDEFNEATGNTRPKNVDARAGRNAGEQQAATDRYTLQAARIRAQQGLPLTDAMKRALERGGVTEEAFVAKYQMQSAAYAPEEPVRYSPAPAPVNKSVMVQSAPHIEIVAAPNMSVQEIGTIVEEKLENHTRRIHEDAAAALSE